jgi:phosphomannomutase
VDAGNGMGGYTVPAVFRGLPLETTELYFELDGSFPNHEANPIDPANLVDLQARSGAPAPTSAWPSTATPTAASSSTSAGELVTPSALTGPHRRPRARQAPGRDDHPQPHHVVAVPEVVREQGGTPVRTRVGHSFIKAEMARTGAVFGGEHSGHFYFADFWNADSGMLAALHALAALGTSDGPLSSCSRRTPATP